MSEDFSPQEQQKLEEYREISKMRHQLLLQRNELMAKMLASQDEFTKALAENASADAKLAARSSQLSFAHNGDAAD